MVKLFVFLIALISWASWAVADDVEKARCEVPELIAGEHAYNEEVCSGIELLRRGNYKSAASHFDKALQMELFEVPNFHLLPRLALSYAHMGEIEKARRSLAEAEITLKVYTRMLECVEKDGAFAIMKRSWSKFYKLENEYQERVAEIMCGDAYTYIYEPEMLSVNIREAELVENYLAIKQKVETISSSFGSR